MHQKRKLAVAAEKLISAFDPDSSLRRTKNDWSKNIDHRYSRLDNPAAAVDRHSRMQEQLAKEAIGKPQSRSVPPSNLAYSPSEHHSPSTYSNQIQDNLTSQKPHPKDPITSLIKIKVNPPSKELQPANQEYPDNRRVSHSLKKESSFNMNYLYSNPSMQLSSEEHPPHASYDSNIHDAETSRSKRPSNYHLPPSPALTSKSNASQQTYKVRQLSPVVQPKHQLLERSRGAEGIKTDVRQRTYHGGFRQPSQLDPFGASFATDSVVEDRPSLVALKKKSVAGKLRVSNDEYYNTELSRENSRLSMAEGAHSSSMIEEDIQKGSNESHGKKQFQFDIFNSVTATYGKYNDKDWLLRPMSLEEIDHPNFMHSLQILDMKPSTQVSLNEPKIQRFKSDNRTAGLICHHFDLEDNEKLSHFHFTTITNTKIDANTDISDLYNQFCLENIGNDKISRNGLEDSLLLYFAKIVLKIIRYSITVEQQNRELKKKVLRFVLEQLTKT